MDEISPTNEIKKMQKGGSLPASSVLPAKTEREGSIETEPKTKERRLSLLNVFKFQRRKSVKELPQEINSDCEKNSDVVLSRPPIKSNNVVPIKGAFAKDKREDLFQNKGIDCNSIEVGDLPKMALDEGQQKTGRWQHVRARLQHRVALPSKPEINLGLDTSTRKKSIHRKLPVDLAGMKMQLSSKSNQAGDERTDNFIVPRQSAKLTDNSPKVPWLRKTSLPFSSLSAQTLCPSENMASDLDKAQQHIIRTDVSSPLPGFSPYSRNSKNPDCIILDQKLNGNKIFMEDENITRHLSQLHISFKDDPSRILYSDENGTVNKSPTEKQIPLSCIDSVVQTPKRTASLPNIANPDGNIFERTSGNSAEVTNVTRVETERNDSELVLNQNHAAFQNLQKKKRFSLAAYRDRNDLIQHTGLHREDSSVVFKQRMSGEGVGMLGRPAKIISRDRHSISSAVMFTRKSHVDIKKSAQKILDSRKELLTRLKHLRVILESFDIAETKAYFEQYFSILYFLFHESFTNVETNLGQRVSKGHKEELDFTILVLEKILTLLPDLIHKRWQLHSIGQIMKKLLHPGNSPKLRREGIRLFVMWYGILMDNATEDCHSMFRSVIPRLLPSGDNCEMELTSGKMFPPQTKVTVPDVAPLLPSQAGDVQPDEPCSWSLECLLAYIASEVSKVEWSNSEIQEHCLKFLFDKFKDHYLPVIFPNLAWKASIYEPSQDLPERILLSSSYDRTLALCQESVTRWIARYTLTASLQNPEIVLQIPENNLGTAEAELVNPGSNASTLSVGSSWTDNAPIGSNTDRNEESFVEQEIIQNVFYSSRENVNIIHEVLRQAFLCPFQIHRSQMVRQVITIYWSWFQNQEKPIFMQEPKLKRSSCSKYPNKRQSVTSTSSSGQLSAEDAETDVRVGLQRILRVFITNSSALFMFDNSFTDRDSVEQQLKLEDQVDICKKVLKMYRDIVTNIILDKTTWEQLLIVLLKVLSTMLSVSPTVSKENSLPGRLAESLFKTMMLAWLKANLSTVVSQQLWKNFTETLSSFTCCVHLIRQWSKTMELLTRILSQCIYDIDLRDLPLDKLNKQKVNRLHGAKDDLKREKDSSLTRNLLEQIMGGVTSRQQKLSSSAVETAASKSDGSVRSVQLSGSQLNSVSCQNEVLHSKCQSQFDLSFSKLSPSTDASGHRRHRLLRRNSDSNIAIESEKLKVSHLRVSDVEDREAQQSSSDAKMDDVFHNDIEETSSQLCHVQGELAGESNSRLVAHQRSLVADCTSVSSAESSSLLPYNALVNSSSCVSSSSGANVIEPSSCSDSDTEALLRTPDSRSGSSHSMSQRPKFRSLSESNSHSKEIVLTEEDEEKGILEEGIEEENLTAETTNRTVDDDDDGAATVCDFEEKKVKQDRDSLQIEDDEAFNVLCSSISPVGERQSILQSGEHVSEWTPDVALVLWQRMLGCLGNVNEIKDSGIHREVFEFLSDLLDVFIKIRDNQGVSKDNQTTPPEPIYVPPILMFSSWCFEAFKLPADYKQGKLVAYQILCTSIMRRHDVDIPQDQLQRFFLVLHYGLTCGSQDVANVLIRCCNTKFFSRSLPGSTLMILDFIRGANTVLSQPVKAKNVPRVEAVSLLGSLLCFQNLLQEIPVLDPNSEDLNVVNCSDIKETILDMLMKFTRNEPTGSSQCIAIDALGLYLYEELCHPGETLHPKLTAAFDILLSMLKLTDKAAVLTTTHVLSLLCDHVPLLLLKLPDLPCEVVKDMTTAVAHFLTATAQTSSSEESKKTTSQILISMMFIMLEWCMRIPQFLLLSYQCQNDQFLLHLVFDALDMVVNGGKRTNLSSAKTSRPLVTSDNQLSNETLHFTSAIDINQETNFPTQKAERPDDHYAASPNKKPVDEDHDSCGLKSAAKAIIFHLINYLNHFPMSTFGATQMSSNVEEHHDTALEAIEPSDLSAQLLASDNTQFFVINNCALISFVEVPIQIVDQNRVTSGLSTEKTVCRIISRDPSGKHCWDSSILYGSQQSQSGPCPTDTQMLQRIEEEEDAKLEESDLNSSQMESRLSLSDEDLHSCANMAPEDDILNIMLQYLSESSPECLLYTGEALNASFHIPEQLSQRVEGLVKDSMIKQQVEERNYINLHSVDKYVTSERKESSERSRSLSPFHLCRLFLSQFGFVTYEKRKNFDLLHKSEKLLRELKHLDNQRCRDTHKIAVIYVGPGQEDKVSILKNSAGSQSFNEFVSALGWQVNLQSHSGFMGGLQRNQTTGSTAPYYSTSTKEVIFHVSTLMPSETEEDQLRKLRHLGNDEVHIIWSEHKRDYRHGIIPTKFGDVLIVIYPLENGLFRIEIIQRPEVPSFGPLFNGAIVSFRVLPGLVRATAISAGQVLRTTRPHYQAFYEERICCIDSIVKKYKLLTTFEAFSSQIYAPSPQMADAENAPYENASLNQNPLQPLSTVSKGGHKSRWRRASTDALFHRGDEDQQATYRKLSLVGGKQKKLKKLQSVSTPPLLSPSFDLQQIK